MRKKSQCKFLNKQVVSKEAGDRSVHKQTSSFSSAQGSSYHAHGVKRRDKNSSNSGKRNSPNGSSTSALMAGVKQSNALQCAFCGKKGHESYQCTNTKGKSSEDRWEITTIDLVELER